MQLSALFILTTFNLVQAQSIPKSAVTKISSTGSPVVVPGSLDDLIADMRDESEGLAATQYTWKFGPSGGLQFNIPSNTESMVLWGVLYRVEGKDSVEESKTNTRVEIRDTEIYARNQNKWTALRKDVTVGGSFFTPRFKTSNSNQFTIEKRNNSIVTMTGNTFVYHFWCKKRIKIEKIAYKVNGNWISKYDGYLFRFRARLVLKDPKGKDDRDEKVYVAQAGADYWNKTDVINDLSGGRFKYVKKEWRYFHMWILKGHNNDDYSKSNLENFANGGFKAREDEMRQRSPMDILSKF